MILSTLCYVKSKGKTLMICPQGKKIEMYNGKWNGLGGKFELDESPEEAVEREVFEESGLKIKNPTLKGIITYPTNGPDDWGVAFVFVAKKFTGKLVESKEGKLGWFTDKEMNKINCWSGDKVFIHLLKKKGTFSAKITYDGDKVKESKLIVY